MACSECRIRDETYAHEAAEWDAEYRRLTARVKELEEQNHRLSEAWKQSRTETMVTSTPGQYISGPRLVTGYEYADLPHGPERGYDDAEKGGA